MLTREHEESLEALRVQAKDTHSLAAQQAYINGLVFHLAALREALTQVTAELNTCKSQLKDIAQGIDPVLTITKGMRFVLELQQQLNESQARCATLEAALNSIADGLPPDSPLHAQWVHDDDWWAQRDNASKPIYCWLAQAALKP
jgi:uncharacterized phage infection (PIP) family protein YhgE